MTVSIKTQTSVKPLFQVLDTTIVILVLYGVMTLLGVELDRAYQLLSMTVLCSVLLFFSSPSLEARSKPTLMETVNHILMRWVVLLAWLVGLGVVTHSIHEFSRTVILAWAVLSPCVLIILHLVLRNLVVNLRDRLTPIRRAVVVGTGDTAQALQRHIQLPAKVEIIGFFQMDDASSCSLTSGDQALGKIQQAADYVTQYGIDIVYIAASSQNEPSLTQLCHSLQDTTACVYYIPHLQSFSLPGVIRLDPEKLPVIPVWSIPYSDSEYWLKRLMDIVLSLIILILISPVMLVISAVVKCSSSGPILFRQRRYGLNGQEITVYKFRSMYVTEDGHDVKQAQRDDPRITPIGRFLRRTSLDELPQFINVLQGRMSIVGPRPHAVSHNELYRKQIRGYMLRHKVKPGITGLAQVNGFRGETDSLAKMEGRVRYDLEYLSKWSLALDVSIFFRTVFTFLRDSNAY